MTADPLNLAALREVAEAGPNQPWVLDEDDQIVARYTLGEIVIADYVNEQWAEFIATFDPPTVLALLDLAERATAAEAAVGAEVWCSPGRQSGQPCLAGTRMPTRTVAGLVDSRGDVAFVQRCYPHLTEQQIWDAIEFESLNGRGKAYRRRLKALMRERRRDLRASLDLAPASEVRDDEGGA